LGTATVAGKLRQEGWGAAMGYPGIDLDEQGDEVEGFIFTSKYLSNHWAALDEFEGDAYERVLTVVKLEDNTTVEASISFAIDIKFLSNSSHFIYFFLPACPSNI
jgi:gamma-glutamylcyclotransferase (GGCT)/AIG2-like uncharacterized protein YtfP